MTTTRDASGSLTSGSNTVVDVALRVDGGRLPVDHAHSLSLAISEALPWFAEAPSAGLHLVHVAESGSGWLRPDGQEGSELHLSRRTRLKLRVTEDRGAEVLALRGTTLDVAGYPLTLVDGKIVPLAPSATLLARHVICDGDEAEATFMPRIVAALSESGAPQASTLCGRSRRIFTPDTVLHTRSILVSNLTPQGSLALQRRGVGPGRKLGCGLFIAYKRIA